MRGAQSISTRRAYGVQRVCRVRAQEPAQLGMTQVLIRDKPGSSGMTPGCDSRGRNDVRGRGGSQARS